MRIYYDPNTTLQTFYLGDIARANIQRQDKKSPLTILTYLHTNQFKVRIYREVYQDQPKLYNGTKVCIGKTNTSERPIAL